MIRLLVLGALLVVLAGCVAIPAEIPPTGPPMTSATASALQSSTCAIRYGSNNAVVVFSGIDGATFCDTWQRVNGSWHEVTVPASLAPWSVALDRGTSGTVCTGSYGLVAWRVNDSGGAVIGHRVCAALNQWAHGGELQIP